MPSYTALKARLNFVSKLGSSGHAPFSSKKTTMKLTQKRVRKMMSGRRRLGLMPVDKEDLGELQLDRGGDTSLLPVVDALNSSAGSEPKSLGELSRATESFDQLPVSQSRESFLVHAPLNTAFKQKSNALLNNNLFRCGMMSPMQDSTKRLYEAVDVISPSPLLSKADVARFLNESQQRVKNWESRGVPSNFAMEFEKAHGVSARWLLFGEGAMQVGASQTDPTPRPTVRAQTRDSAENLPLIEDSAAGKLPHNNSQAADSRTGNVPIPIQYSVDKSKFRPIPVVGRAQGGMPERIWTDGDYPVGATDKYAEVATSDPHAFLTPIVGTSMSPRYNPGEFALVEPATDPELEDDVLVRLTTGETMLKRLVSRRGGVQLASYNEPGTMLYDETEITWMYYVAHPVPARKIKQRV
ncbi:S24 family peptidase [Caballeronia sp. LZ035]|uniref:LexA family transcriptional regulator n=1 Tax=Caballeronia sp. LZ035 TaxID=3038568 RepID=UPI00285A5C26|nr:S24 family peptidase [Caballeronia sp. LZ035]MDR5756995.1 S24 family peptidase [Caballeronia sp. LZ035]